MHTIFPWAQTTLTPTPPPAPAVPQSDRMLHPRQVAAMYGVDAKTIRRWAIDGKLPHILTPGGHRRFSENAIRELIEKTRK